MNHSKIVGKLARGIRLSVVAAVAILLASLLVVTQPVRAGSIKVENTNNSGPGSLRQAITDANTNPGPDTITFVSGLSPIVLAGAASEDANASGDLDILDGGDLTIQGNGVGNTIIDGGGIDRVFHVCPGGGCANTVTFKDMTIQNGITGGTGGGIYNKAGTTTLNGCTVSANQAHDGGGITNEATLNVKSSAIGGFGVGNTATYGGGIYNKAGTTTMDDSTVSYNTVMTMGGGIYNMVTLYVQTSSIVASNTASNNGGGIYNAFGATTVDGSTVRYNDATNGGGIYNLATLTIQNGSTIGGSGVGNTVTNDGGGIYNSTGTTTVDGSTVSANTANNNNGGGIYNNDTLIVQNGSTIGGAGAGNDSLYHGGGIYNASGGTTTVDGSTVSANMGAHGAGIYNNDTLIVQNGSTIGGAGAGNSNCFEGGGINNQPGATTTVDSSTVSANIAGWGGGILNWGTLNVQNGSTIGGAGAGNTAKYGGGIRNYTGTTTVDGSTVSANTAIESEGSGGYGGGISNGGDIYLPSTLTVQNGSTIGGAGEGNTAANDGGGIYNDELGVTTVTSSTVSANTATNDGGGVFADQGGVNIQAGSTIGGAGAGNAATRGGGIYQESGLTTVDGSTVSANTAVTHGGGIYNKGTLTVQNGSIVSANTAVTYGGGIYNKGTLTVQNGSTIGGAGAGNTANRGGGINNGGGGTTTLDGSTVSANTATGNGGGIANSGTLNVQNGSTIGGAGAGNSATTDGGGIYNDSGTIMMDGSAVSANTATNGGGIYNWGMLTVQNGSTIGGPAAGNTATTNGGGIYNYSGTIMMDGSRIQNNTAANGGGVFNSGVTSVTGSCIVGNSATSFLNNQPAQQIATGNWWGAATGPNTLGADTVAGNVDTSGYLTESILDCTFFIYLPLILK